MADNKEGSDGGKANGGGKSHSPTPGETIPAAKVTEADPRTEDDFIRSETELENQAAQESDDNYDSGYSTPGPEEEAKKTQRAEAADLRAEKKRKQKEEFDVRMKKALSKVPDPADDLYGHYEARDCPMTASWAALLNSTYSATHNEEEGWDYDVSSYQRDED